ncbi:hypothetical protein FHR75_000919 [Kineococcus radiotolerans]|uniref:UPF0182 protein Krad_1193 n=2 Tax=Kineococcus radiotolerans TaxID=131568 RepID=Y1193_KINRD|nr:UPF0182 family protein [Kineococcus radiotolerans]A6W792.1 RecName: Full=UPF0182 protein Krad_1193 [Kineococcus radiotolerans SRS30216 = ATCC BAA-149]ABS02681.1 protein of unknown function UPF0182 [Kineococcus radiotolerans SRS30216 = ATCC BAA-149]MBB2900131.1 hypothetical protein [Kineococcus radiotolerans]
MSFSPRGPSRPVLRRRRRGAALPTVVILVAVVIAVVVGARITADVWWFDQLGFLPTFTTKLWLQVLLFTLGALLLAAAVAVSLTLGYRARPIYAPVSDEQAGLDRYRESLEPLRRLVVVVLSAAAGLFGGSVAMSRWETLLLWWNRVDFGTRDEQFRMDQGFYVFTLPWLAFLVSFLTAAVVLAGIAGLAAHYLYGGLRLSGAGPRTTRAARVHLASLAAAFLLLRAAGYWLDRYELMTTSSGYVRGVVGPTYTDVHAVLPSKAILALIAVVVALLFVAAAVGTSWRLPAIGTGLLVVSAIAIGGIYPWAVQRFQVTPNRQSLESEYVGKNIDATRDAYDLSDVEVSTYAADTTASQGQLSEDAQTIPSVRLLDPSVVSQAFQQTQGQRGYYKFGETLDVDRYATPDGGTQDAVVAARELNLAGLADNQRTWVNEHTIYTHGYGVVVAQGNDRAPDGSPSYVEANVPTSGDLDLEQPRIYFGEGTTTYSIVGGRDNEIDYPDGSAGGFATTEYDGSGGVAVGSLLQKLVYGLKFGDQNILLSGSVTPESRILYDRTPRERVEKVAPWLTMDGDAYPSIVDGRVVWILDGYTTSNSYPYSAATELGDATTDALTQTQGSSVQALQDRTVNYVRNSVKATVDAYTGKVDLYAWDDTDPVLKAWMKAFPGAVEPLSAIDGSLMQHLRYPQDMFKVQREVLTRYHVTDPASFLTGQDFWDVPGDPTVDAAAGTVRPSQPPYYLTLRMPEQDTPTYSLTTTYVPASNANASGTQVLRGFAAVDSDAGSTKGTKSEGYGTIRLLELPQSTTVNGPVQIQNNIRSDTAVADQVRLLSVGDNSRVIYGNLLTLPVGGGLLYVEPIYAQSTGDNSFPRLSRVVAVFGDNIAIANTLDEALDEVFGGNSGAGAGDEGAPPPTAGTPAPTDGATGGPAPDPATGDAQVQLQQALDNAKRAIQDSSAALAEGDFTKYGEAQQRLRAAVDAASAAEARLERSGTSGPTSSSSPSASSAPPVPGETPAATPTP